MFLQGNAIRSHFSSATLKDAASGDNDDGADIQPVVLPLPATPAPLATAAFADPRAAPLIAEARAVLTGQYLPATPAATPSRFYGRVPPPARPGK